MGRCTAINAVNEQCVHALRYSQADGTYVANMTVPEEGGWRAFLIQVSHIIYTAKSNTGRFPCTTTYDLLDGSKVICLRALGGVRVRGCGYMCVT